jgi:hypothetical protein
VEEWTGSSWLRTGTDGGHFECGNEPSGSIKCGEFLDYLKPGQLLKKDSVPWSKYRVLLGNFMSKRKIIY